MTKAEIDFVVRICEYTRGAYKTGEHDKANDIFCGNAFADQKECALRIFEYYVANDMRLEGLMNALLE